MKIWAMISIVLINTIWAQGYSYEEELVESLDNYTSDTISPWFVECGGEHEAQRELDIQQCLVDLCGEFSSENTVWVTEENFENNIDETVLNEYPEMASDILNMFDYFQGANKIIIEELERRLADPNSPLNNLGASEASIAEYSFLIYSQHYYDEVDHTKPLEERLTVRTAEHDLGEDFDEGLQDFVERRRKAILNGSLYEKILSGIYTPNEAMELLREEVNKLKTKVRESFVDSDTMMSLRDLEEYFNDLTIGGDELSQQLIQNLSTAVVNVNYMVDPDSFQSVFTMGTICQSGPCFDFAKDRLQNFDLQNKIAELKKKNDSYMAKKTYSNCKNELISLTALRVFNEDKFSRENLPKIIQNYKDKVISRFSEETGQYINKAIDEKLEFILPSNKDLTPQDVMMQKFDMLNFVLPPLDNESLPQHNDNFFLNYLDNLTEDGDINPFLPVEEMCMPGPVFMASDSFMPQELNEMMALNPLFSEINPSLNTINVSPFSCNHELGGEHILSHELGHFISSLFNKDGSSEKSREDFLKIRECASGLHRNNSPDLSYGNLFYFPNDREKTEEDTADILAFIAIPDEINIRGCYLLEPGEAGGFTTLGEEVGPHSSSMFRVLNEAVQKGTPLSQACRNTLNHVSDEYEVMKCY